MSQELPGLGEVISLNLVDYLHGIAYHRVMPPVRDLGLWEDCYSEQQSELPSSFSSFASNNVDLTS